MTGDVRTRVADGGNSNEAESELLSTHDLTKTFGGNVAVDDVSFDLEAGQIVGIIGPNGAGKTTLFNLLTGFERPDRGQIVFDGGDVTDLAPDERATRGMVRTFQLTRELAGMSVMDNLLLAGPNDRGEKVVSSLVGSASIRRREQANREQAEGWLEFLDLWELRDEFSGNLSGGQRKLLELGRALMTDPELLLLDEPTAGVNPTLTNDILDRIEQLRDSEGVSFLIIEHDMDAIMSISDTIIGMANGSILTMGTPEAVRADEQYRDVFIGGA